MDFSILSRRKFLAAGLGLGGVVFMGGASLWTLRGQAPGVAGLRCLTDHEYRTCVALAGALFPQELGSLDLGRAFDEFLADESEWNRSDLKKALFLLEYGPVVFERRLTTFSNLSQDERLAHFERWMNADSLLRRQVALAFRKFMSLVFYDRPEIWPLLGYDGPFVPLDSATSGSAR